MNKKTLKLWMLQVIVLSIVSCNDIADNPVVYTSFEQELTKTKLFTDIKENPDTMVMKKKAKGELDYQSQYSMMISQPVHHNQPDGDRFKQKVCILFRGYDRPTIMVTEGYLWSHFMDAEDLGINLNANMVHVEHRNFGESYNQDKGKWEYETSAQASADLHAVYQALKPIFKGKWMCTGTSKNGETSMDYAYYYPNDMDLAAAFGSPFNVSLSDKAFGQYLFNEVGTEELREGMKKNIRWALADGEKGLYLSACEKLKEEGAPEPSFTEYVFNVFDTFFSIFQYTLPAKHQERLEAMTKDKETYVKEICNTIKDNRDMKLYTYFVDCAKEQGFPNPGYDYFADLLEGTSFKAEDVLASLLKEEDRWLLPYYDNSQRIDIRERFFVNSTVPLLFFYSKDDPWSAGQPDKLGPNAKKVINPIGVHSPKINDPAYCPAEIKQEVMDYIQTYIY
jgi:hypothetical protein